MRVNHNIPALNAWRQGTIIQRQMSKTLERLSSGLRINRAADDAAGLAISEKMRAQIRGLDQATRNAQDGISLIQTAEGALNETHSILQRMRELSVQAANDTYTSTDRQEIQKEIDQLTSEIDRIAATTEFNNKKLLDGSTSALVSTDDLETKVFMRGGLRVLDQFGQKARGGGNYKLNIEAEAGVNEVQKSDIMKIKHGLANEITEETMGDGRRAYVEASVSTSAGTGAATANFVFTINGTTYSASTGIAAGDTIASIVDTLVNDVNNDLGDYITASSNGAIVKFEAVNYNTDFTFNVTITGNAATESFEFGEIGAVSLGGTTTESATINTQDATGGGAASADGINFIATTQNVTDVALIDSYEMVEGSYSIDTARNATTAAAAATISAQYTKGPSDMVSTASIAGSVDDLNASIAFRVTGVSGDDITLEYMLHQMDENGVYNSTTEWTAITASSGATKNIGDLFGLDDAASVTINFEASSNITQGDAFVMHITAAATNTANDTVTLNSGTDEYAKWSVVSGAFDNAETELRFFQIDADGQVKDTRLNLETDKYLATETVAAEFTVATGKGTSTIGNIAQASTSLYDIDRFWDASGNFILEEPQTIKLVQGDGKTTSITLSGADTIEDVVSKLNDAIGGGLSQTEVVGTENADNFVSYVETPDASGKEAVQGTFVIRSAIAGDDGKITFVGDDDTINALSLTTIQQSENNAYTIDVTDAHDGTVVASGVKVSENQLNGIIHENVDVQFSADAGINVSWNSTSKDFTLTGGESYAAETFVHLADRTMVLHIGANQKQDIGTGIGNMSSNSLGVENVQVTSNELANEAIGKIDGAIGMVSSERSKLGAIQNRLDHTINNLGVTMENLTAAESRIRDADMAQEMMEFTKLQILSQSANAMLAQANQLPQNVLQLLR